MQQALSGRVLRDGEYVVRDVLGHGGMANVYRAYSRSLETDLALKVLAPQLAADADLRDKFHEEARLLSRLFHPNLLTVHYFGEEGETVYIAMRLVTGGTLRDRMRAMGGRLDLLMRLGDVRTAGVLTDEEFTRLGRRPNCWRNDQCPSAGQAGVGICARFGDRHSWSHHPMTSMRGESTALP